MSETAKKIKKLEKDLALERQKLQHIFNISRQTIGVLTSPGPNKLYDVLQKIIDETTEVLDSEIGSIFLIAHKTNLMSLCAAKGLDKELTKNRIIKIGESVSGWVAKHKKAVLVKDIEKDSRFARQNREQYYTKSLISAPIVADHTLLGVINVNNKRDRQPYKQEDLDLLQTLANHAALVISNVNLFDRLQLLYMDTVETLAEAIDTRDHYTKTHSDHVGIYALAIAQEMGLSEYCLEVVTRAAKLHDIGKIGIHDYILTKPGKLTKEEWQEMKTHALKGAQMLEPLTFLNGVIETVRQHHERYDGGGYPNKKKSSEIRIEARIMAVADAFDAMTTNRSYAAALTKKEAIAELKKESGKQFDPEVVKVLLRLLKTGKINILTQV